MATQYFCDVCKKEVSATGERIWIGGMKTRIEVICIKCWLKIEKLLLNSN